MSEERAEHIRRLRGAEVDVLIVGGGINGAVAAAALAGHGISVALVERSDFASGVSSQSSNLAWGGIKYLESREFRLVRKLCLSRNRLMAAYPSQVREIRFFTSIRRGFRFWPVAVWAGALLYWLMGNGKLSPPRYLRRRDIAREAPEVAQTDIVGGVAYSDCYLVENDARFVFGFVRRAMDAGALAANYLAVAHLAHDDATTRWRAELKDGISGDTLNLSAQVVVNAAGPAVNRFNAAAAVATEHRHVLSKGIHLIVDRIGSVERVLTFFASDGRLFFVIPMGNRTCIGTTDTPTDSAREQVSEDDRDFVLANANALLTLPRPLTRDDVIAERVGVRPLAVAGQSEERDWVQLSRKHIIEGDAERRFLSIFGGKLTDCLNVGEEIVARVAALGVSATGERSAAAGRWYGEASEAAWARYVAAAAHQGIDQHTPTGADAPLSALLWRRYGEDAFAVLRHIEAHPQSAQPLFPGVALIRAELAVLLTREMVVCEDDLLRRRSMAALMLPTDALNDSDGLATLRTAMSSGLEAAETALASRG